MSRKAYHETLKEVQQEVVAMSEMAVVAIRDSVESLRTRDFEASKKVAENDININRKRYEIEDKCLLLMATQQPMAVDLRMLAAVLHIITDLERIADHAEGIAKINLLIGEDELVKPLIQIPKMAEKAVSMLERCIKAFEDKDIETARSICDEDDEVDDLYDEVYKELLHLMIKNPDIIQGATYLTWASHNLERVADRVTNIAERVVFMVTGVMEEMNVSKY